jgi:hypothetical protein
LSSFDFLPALTSIHIFTEKNSNQLILVPNTSNKLRISCTISGLNRRTVEIIHEKPDYLAIYFTLFHQFGGKETTIVRRYMLEYDPEQEDKYDDIEEIDIDIPIDDDFSEIDFVLNYYFLQISITHKHPGEMGISESIRVGKIFETKIPFIIQPKEVQ